MMLRKKIISGIFLILFLNLFLVQSVFADEKDYRVVVFYDTATNSGIPRGLNNWVNAMNQKYPLSRYNPRFEINGCGYGIVNYKIDTENLVCGGLTQQVDTRFNRREVFYTYLIRNDDGSEKSVRIDPNSFKSNFPIVLIIDNSFSKASVIQYSHPTSDTSLQELEFRFFFKCNNDSVCRDEIKNCGVKCIEGRCVRFGGREYWNMKPYPDCSNKTAEEPDVQGLEEIRINASEQSSSYCSAQTSSDAGENYKCPGICTERNNAVFFSIGNYLDYVKSVNDYSAKSVYAQSTGITTFDLIGINTSSIASAKVCYFVQSPGQGELYLFYPPWSADSCTITPLVKNIDEKLSESFEISGVRTNDLICFNITKTKFPIATVSKKARFTPGIKYLRDSDRGIYLHGINPPYSPFMIITGKRECIPNCDEKQCGDDGCGGSCGECSGETNCANNCQINASELQIYSDNSKQSVGTCSLTLDNPKLYNCNPFCYEDDPHSFSFNLISGDSTYKVNWNGYATPKNDFPAESTGIVSFDLEGIDSYKIDDIEVCFSSLFNQHNIRPPTKLFLVYSTCPNTPFDLFRSPRIGTLESQHQNINLNKGDYLCYNITDKTTFFRRLADERERGRQKLYFSLGGDNTSSAFSFFGSAETEFDGISYVPAKHKPYILIKGEGIEEGINCSLECSTSKSCIDGQCIANEICSSDSECRELHQDCDWSCSDGQCINIGLVEMTSFPECEPVFGSCTDSDIDDEHLDGINFNVQGNSVNSEFSEGLSDYCWSNIDEDGDTVPADFGDYVTEFYCSEGNIFAEAFECEYGCEDGACLLAPRENVCENEGGYCTDYEDSIGTIVIDENGELQFISNAAEDVCGEGKVLIQDIDLGCPIEKPSCCFPVPNEDSCYDSDIDEEHRDGINELLSGNVKFDSIVSEDVCTRTLFETILGLKSTKVFENYCFENEPENVVIDCAEGFECRDARCCYIRTCEKDYAGFCADNLDDGCGESIDCSNKCPEGQSCNEDSLCSVGDCIPKTCALDYFGECGSNLDNGCSGTIDCSNNCLFGQICNENFRCSVGDCIPQCLGKSCGDDGCGNTLNCGSCASGTCNDDGQCVSSCERKTCLGDYANQCGNSLSDGCRGTIDCSDECPSGKTCSDGVCVVSSTSCKTCGDYANQCGENLSDNCSGFLNCSNNCPDGKECNNDGQCITGSCIPKTCTELGKFCGSADDGCGNPLNCGTCPAINDSCKSNVCVSGRCEIQTKANRESCNDGDICRSGKVCINGNCVGGTTKVPLPTGCSCTSSNFNLCPSPNPANECKKKVCNSGVCGIENDNGKSCTDSNNKEGTCQNGICACTPQCIDSDGFLKECGDDGCGGSCGDCSGDEFCSEDRQCVSLLEPDMYIDFIPDSCSDDSECRTRKNPCKICENNECVSINPNLLEDCLTYDGRNGICCNNGYKITCVRDLSYCKDVISCFSDDDCDDKICDGGYCVEKQCGIKNNLWYKILRFLGLYRDCPEGRTCNQFRCVAR